MSCDGFHNAWRCWVVQEGGDCLVFGFVTFPVVHSAALAFIFTSTFASLLYFIFLPLWAPRLAFLLPMFQSLPAFVPLQIYSRTRSCLECNSICILLPPFRHGRLSFSPGPATVYSRMGSWRYGVPCATVVNPAVFMRRSLLFDIFHSSKASNVLSSWRAHERMRACLECFDRVILLPH